MKTIKALMFVGLMSVVFFGCEKEDAAELNLNDIGKKAMVASDLPMDYCNYEPVELILMAGQHYESGSVEIVNDEEYLYVKFTASGDLLLEEVHVFVGLKEDVPSTKKGIPIPGRFDYKLENINESTATLIIPLSDIPEDCFIILAHAALSNGETAWGWEYENDEFTFENYFKSKRWGYLGEYCIAECDEGEFLTFKFFYTNQDSTLKWVYGLLGSDEQYYDINNWCKYMGVVKVEGSGAYIVKDNKGNKMGVAEIGVNDDYISVDILLDDENLIITKTHCFYGSLEELNKFGTCPTYWGFPYPEKGSDQDSFIIPL